jgi:hypothetical protein
LISKDPSCNGLRTMKEETSIFRAGVSALPFSPEEARRQCEQHACTIGLTIGFKPFNFSPIGSSPLTSLSIFSMALACRETTGHSSPGFFGSGSSCCAILKYFESAQGMGRTGLRDFAAHCSSSRLRAFAPSVSPKPNKDALLPSHRTPCQNPLPSRYMILNFAIEPWCRYSICRKTDSKSSATEHLPKPV